jgi:hypothetical protein
MKKPAEFIITYRCEECQTESMYTENDEAYCRYCDKPSQMTVISKAALTPELLEQRLKEMSDRIFSNLQSAYKSLTESETKTTPEGVDAEKELLMILAKAKAFRESIQKLELKDPETPAE